MPEDLAVVWGVDTDDSLERMKQEWRATHPAVRATSSGKAKSMQDETEVLVVSDDPVEVAGEDVSIADSVQNRV